MKTQHKKICERKLQHYSEVIYNNIHYEEKVVLSVILAHSFGSS